MRARSIQILRNDCVIACIEAIDAHTFPRLLRVLRLSSGALHMKRILSLARGGGRRSQSYQLLRCVRAPCGSVARRRRQCTVGGIILRGPSLVEEVFHFAELKVEMKRARSEITKYSAAGSK